MVKLKNLNLGCGADIYKSTEFIKWINVDWKRFEGVNIIHNLNYIPYPFDDESCDEIVMNDILEHLNDPIDILKEAHRILRPEGKLIIKVVYWNHKYTWSDMTHLRGFSEISFNWLIGKGRPLGEGFQFSSMEIEYIYDNEAIKKWGSSETILREKAYHYCNVIQGMIITLIK